MLNERSVREHPDETLAGLRRRHAGPDAERTLEQWLALDAGRRATATRRDALARRVAELRDAGGTTAGPDLRAAEHELRAVEEALVVVTAQARRTLQRLPNLPDTRVPEGDEPERNVEVRRWGEPPAFDFTPRRHDELGAALDILDLPRATRLSGPRFPLLIGAGARLARALASFMLDLHTAHGYVEIAPPHLLKTETLEGTGHLPRFADDLYAIPHDDLWLSPTAEAQLVALHAGETLPEARLPLAYTACAPAFRREAGSARSATRGLIRQHQFDKVELVRLATPETADAAFDAILAESEEVLRQLGLPYRVVALCAGDLPFASQRTLDLEVWMPGQGRYVEIASISDCGPFQSRRLNIRYKPSAGGRARHPHTLNGSALPIGRTLAALLEHGQRADGSVALPDALAAYMGMRRLDRQR
jgi:seryl-tRNA synthetase